MIILLTIIAVVEVIRLLLLFKPTTKKTFFKSRLKGVEQKILDLEFNKFKLEQIREGERRIRDDYKMRLDGLVNNIKSEGLKLGLEESAVKEALTQPEPDKVLLEALKGVETEKVDEFKRLLDQKVLIERDIKRQEDQMDLCDKEIYGVKRNADNPQGAPGLIDEIDSMTELKEMLSDYIKKNI